MAEEEYYKRKLALDREYYERKLEMEFARKGPKLLDETAHWKEFEHSAGVAAAAATMAVISVGENEGLEAGVAALTTACATARATSALAVASSAKTLNFVRSFFHEN